MDVKLLREQFQPVLPKILSDLKHIHFSPIPDAAPVHPAIKELFPLTDGDIHALQAHIKPEPRTFRPLRVGVVFSGGQAPGGHNVISGLFDALHSFHPHSKLYGFQDGPSGIIAGKYKELTAQAIQPFRNQGGFELIGSGRTKIESEEDMTAALSVVQNLKLDGLVIIGGDDSNTNAAVLAEFFLKNECRAKVIGVPKTIDGDLTNAYVAISFGFDTACKIYSEVIGNICKDALSARKYYHFIRLMGRSASHIALECALATRPNMTLIGEEIADQKWTVSQLTKYIADLICRRADIGKNYGVILVPEGLIEFIPEIGALIKELNLLLAASPNMEHEEITQKLSPTALLCFEALPTDIQKQLLINRDVHGNVQVSLIETEKMLIESVRKELHAREKEERYKGKFEAQAHFFGYEGRAGYPSNFDCNYCYALGMTSALLIEAGVTGYMCAIQNLTRPAPEWQLAAVPLTSLMHLEVRKGVQKPVIKKTFVDLGGKAFGFFKKHREEWAVDDTYLCPGPIQFFGPSSITDTVPNLLYFSKARG